MVSVLNRRLDVGEGRERVLKSRVDLLQGRLQDVFGGDAAMPWEEIEMKVSDQLKERGVRQRGVSLSGDGSTGAEKMHLKLPAMRRGEDVVQVCWENAEVICESVIS